MAGVDWYNLTMIGFVKALFLKALGGSRNERLVRGYLRFVRERVNPLEEQMRALSEEGMRERSQQLRERLKGGEARDSVKAEAFALIREASRRARSHRQFDVQLVAGQVLDGGWIAEEATGEGKTIACYPAIYMAVLEGMHAHVVTTNDYLVQRDAEFAAPVFELLGVSVGFIRAHMPNRERKVAYACDVTYGTNSEFGFDYLRDNTKLSPEDQVQRSLDFAIVDEVDSILIDEARTPLILSGPAHGDTERFRRADRVAREVIRLHRPWDQANRRVEAIKRDMKALNGEAEKARGDEEKKSIAARMAQAESDLAQAEQELQRHTKFYEVELDRRAVYMTHEGVGAAQEIAGVGSFYVGANMEWPHLMEQALRAHVVFLKDKEYVVADGKVVIVDEFTGRLMQGREWSDGLHQAVEAKEGVPIKQENQTMATVTIQNYFKLYRKLAGMTGTAMTEAGEFLKIYKLDVVSIPTHRPVNRVDHEDRIYGTVDSKFDAMVEEINEVCKRGRPVLVGTTSVEKSERISEALTRRHGIQHEVLNARPENAAREADIVALAGTQHPLKKDSDHMVGSVTIATNMAGRGTDIKLGPGVVYDKCKVPSVETFGELGVAVQDLYPPGTTKCCIHCPEYDPATNCAHCFKPKLDSAFPARGKKDCPEVVPCGLHIVGTERHEARRIDNQLRGRSGRQGDPGSSRFFLSLRDDLMAVFAGEWTLKVLGWLGLQGDVAIEDRRVSGGVERAQKKVEERNFEMRKNLLEYDEVMDYQRRGFYGQRQQILTGRQLDRLVWEMIDEAIDEGIETYLSGSYSRRCIAEWSRSTLQISLDESQVSADAPEDLPALEGDLRARAKEEAENVVSVTLGEYMSDEEDPKAWDLRGLSAWAMSRFNVSLSQNQLRAMNPQEVHEALVAAAAEKIDQADLSPLIAYLEPGFPEESLAEWAQNKFGLPVSPKELEGGPASARDALRQRVEQEYRRREVVYPVEHAIEMTIGHSGADNVYALNALADWARRKYESPLTTEDLQGMKIPEIHQRLVQFAEAWSAEGRIERAVREGVGEAPTPEAAVAFARERFDTDLDPASLDGNAFERLAEVGRSFLRREMTALERFILLQIYDGSWVDHLLAMDHLKSAIGLRGFAEQDPRVAYKREGAKQFDTMWVGIRDKVTDLIFKVRLTPEAEVSSAYNISGAVHEQLSGYDHLAQEMDQQTAQGELPKVETIVRETPRVGRNDPCPCGSGKKYKKCHGHE